jgi:predicted aspartyl protease
MRFLTFCSAFIPVGIFFFHFSAAAQTADTTSVPIRMVDGTPVVQVTLNGKGTYDFILDTGFNYTAVQRKVLAELSVPLGDDGVSIDTAMSGVIHEHKTTVESMSVGGLTVQQMSVCTLDSTVLSQNHNRISGILGESFLKNFDILLDNEKKILVLDRTSRLADSLAGERLPFSRYGVRDGSRTLDRIVVELNIPRYRQQSLRCLVDSGASYPFLLPERSEASRLQVLAHPSGLVTLNGEGCIEAGIPLIVGGSDLRTTEFFSCRNMTREAADTDCLLPTHLFKKIFVSHTNSYLIVNPKRDARKMHELADVVPFER